MHNSEFKKKPAAEEANIGKNSAHAVSVCRFFSVKTIMNSLVDFQGVMRYTNKRAA